MQIGTSYLQKPHRQDQRLQDYAQRKSTTHEDGRIGLASQASAGIASTQVGGDIPESSPRPAKGRTAVRFLYRWVVRLVLFGSLVLLVSLILFLWAPKSRPSTAKELPRLPNMTAMTAYDLARPVTLRWAKDSLLLSVSGTWDSGSNVLDGEGDWSLLFYSPSKSAIALVSVTEGSATVVNTHGVMKQPRAQSAELWRLDSPEVVNVLRSNGGDDFLQAQPQAGLVLSLNLVGETTWRARLINQETRRILEVQLDADDGELTEIRQSG